MKALVIGYGSIGKRHISNLSSFPNMEIIICTKQKYDKFLKKNNCKIFASVDECLKNQPDFVIVSNVTSLHLKTSTKIANSGIPIFIEKPLSDSLKGAKHLLDVVKKKKLVTLMGCVLRFHPCIAKIKEMVSNNEIGRIISVRVENGSYLPDWHPCEDYRNSYASNKDLGGGVVLTSIHEIDYLYWLFGNVKEVFSITGKFSDLELDVDDLSCMLLLFENNIVAEIHLDYFQKPNFRSCKIIGTKGSIYWDSNINMVRMYDTKKNIWVNKLKLRNYDSNIMYVKELLHFIKCINKNEKTINSIEEGVYVLKIALAAKQSSKIKRVIMLN